MDWVSTPLGSGALAGLATCISLQPLDYVKTRLQETKGSQSLGGRLQQVWRTTPSLPCFWRGTGKKIEIIEL